MPGTEEHWMMKEVKERVKMKSLHKMVVKMESQGLESSS